MDLNKLRDEIESLLWRYWENLPEPKMNYVNWWYGDGRFYDLLNERPSLKDVLRPMVDPGNRRFWGNGIKR